MKPLKGLVIDNFLYEAAHKACLKRVEESNGKLVIHYDIESGFPSVITKEQNDQIKNMFNSILPQKPLTKGIIMFWGTGGSIESKDDWTDVFLNPKK